MPSILVVEQEERYVERIRAALSSEGWRVRVVPRADQAIQAAASEAPDLVMVSAEVPAAGTLAGAFSRSGGGPGVVGLLPEGAAFPAPGFTADDLLAKPFSDEDLRAAARRTLEARRPAAPSAPPPPAVSQGEQKLTSMDIFGDVLAEMEDDSPPPAAAPAPAGPPPMRPASAATPVAAVAAVPSPRPAPLIPQTPLPQDDEMQRRLEKTLSGMLTPEPKPRPAAPPPPAPPAATPPPRRAETSSADNVDALLSKTLSNLDLGRTKTGVRPPPPAPAPATPPPAAPPVAAAPAPAPPSRPAPAAPPPAPVSEGTGVRKPRTPQMVGDFDFSELEELARTGRPSSPSPPPSPTAPPRPAAPPVATAPAPAPPAPTAPTAPVMAAPAALPFQPPPAAGAAPAFSLADSLADAATTQRIPVFADEPGDGERFGQYRLLERIAVGGMAEVWKARMRGVEGFQKTVAIKKILPHMTDNAEFVGMFIDEAKLAAQLSHPNIVHIYDLGKIGRDYYIAMEYVEGKDLRSLLNSGRHKGLPLPLGLSLMIAARVASALDYAHRKRDFEDREMELVHRDVSPQNVLLTYEGDVKLCDFGIAKAVSKASHTQMGALKGKLQYMSPEQAWGRPVDARSDLFSLGSVLFEMVTGDRLFSGDSEMSVLEAVRQGRVRSPRQVSPSVPVEVDDIVVRALAVDPQSRFQTAGEMKQRLEAALATLALQHGPTDLAAYIHRVLEPDAAPVETSPEEPAPVSWRSGPAIPAPVMTAPVVETPAEMPMDMGGEAPVAPVAPVGEVMVEEGGRKSRTLLYAAIAALLVVAVLTFWFLSRRNRGETQPSPETSAQAQGATPAPVPAVSEASAPVGPQATPAPAANVQAIVDQKLAQQEEAMRKKLEQQQKDLEKQLAAAKASGAPLPAGQTAAAVPPVVPPAQTPAVRPPDPVPSPAPPEPEPQREPEPKAEEKAPPPAPEPAKLAPAAPRTREGDLVSMGAGVIPPQLVSFPKAEYPPLARKLRVEGVVVVSVLIDENGQVQETRMEEPIKQKVGINEAALSAARSARYKPATKEGVRVKMWTRLRIPFKL
jgi:TonB family protein